MMIKYLKLASLLLMLSFPISDADTQFSISISDLINGFYMIEVCQENDQVVTKSFIQ